MNWQIAGLRNVRTMKFTVFLTMTLPETADGGKAMDKTGVEFRGDAGTLIRYEDIVLWRDVVFLVWDRPYDEEVQSIGAPAVGIFNYTGYLNKREGTSFGMTYFSLVVADGHMPISNGTRILADGGVSYQGMTYDENSMRFWRTGKLVVTPNVAEQERKNIEHEAEGERLIAQLDTIIQHKMAHGTLETKQYDRALALYLECKKPSNGFGTPAWHRRQRVFRTFEDQFLKYPSK
jgi:hypothetical protein